MMKRKRPPSPDNQAGEPVPTDEAREDWKLRLALLKKSPAFLKFWGEHGEKAREVLGQIEALYSFTHDDSVTVEAGKKLYRECCLAVGRLLLDCGLIDLLPPSPVHSSRRTLWMSVIEYVREALTVLDPRMGDLSQPLSLPFFRELPAVASVRIEGTPDEGYFGIDMCHLLPLKPSQRVLVIDLSRKRKDLIGEFRQYLDQVEYFRNSDDCPASWKENYTKWELPKTKHRGESWKALKVWELYQQGGKRPIGMTFVNIARRTGRPISTVKSQWYRAYELIHGEKFTRDVNYSTEDTKAEATALCAKCPHELKCYKTSEDELGWFPCGDYLKVARRDRSVNETEYKDDVHNPEKPWGRVKKHKIEY